MMNEFRNFIDTNFDVTNIKFDEQELRNGISPLSLFYQLNNSLPEMAEFWEFDTKEFLIKFFVANPDLNKNEVQHNIYDLVRKEMDPYFRIVFLSKDILLHFSIHTHSLYIYHSKAKASVVALFEKIVPDYEVFETTLINGQTLTRLDKLRKLSYLLRIKNICASVLDLNVDLINENQTISSIVELGHKEQKKRLGSDYKNEFDGAFYQADYDCVNIIIKAEEAFKVDMPYEDLERNMTIEGWANYIYRQKMLIEPI